jgi:hypothetical protein
MAVTRGHREIVEQVHPFTRADMIFRQLDDEVMARLGEILEDAPEPQR